MVGWISAPILFACKTMRLMSWALSVHPAKREQTLRKRTFFFMQYYFNVSVTIDFAGSSTVRLLPETFAPLKSVGATLFGLSNVL